MVSDEVQGLLAEMKGSSSFKMMGLDDYDQMTSDRGLMESTQDFNSKHLALVKHFVRGAQAFFSWVESSSSRHLPFIFRSFTIHPGIKLTSLEEGRKPAYIPDGRCLLSPGDEVHLGESTGERLWQRYLL